MSEKRTTGDVSRGAPEKQAGSAANEGSVENFYAQATDAARTVADQASGLARQAYREGEHYIQEGRRRYPQAESYYRDGTHLVEQQVHASPWLALLLAGAVGYVFALLVHGRD
jgi:ElaB/YqjD/DUF883 family membrane-anchored ribosome-binding protein